MNSVEEKQFCVEMINELKLTGLAGIKTGYSNCLPQIKQLMVHNAPFYLGYKSMNQLLIKELGFVKSTASEISKVAERFYYADGTIDPFYKDFQYTMLVRLAQNYNDKQLQLLRENNILNCNLTRNDLVWIRNQYFEIQYAN